MKSVQLALILCFYLQFPADVSLLDIKDLGEEFQKLGKTLHDACFKKTSVEQNMIEEVRKGNFLDDPRIKAYVTCLWTESTVLDEAGNLNYELMMDMMPSKMKGNGPIIKTCFDKSVEGKLEEKVYVITECIYKANPSNFLIF